MSSNSMAHVDSFRQGWNHERFAQFILGKVSFISTPETCGDDIGIDVSGLFVKRHPTKPKQVLPFLPYTIQVKPPTWNEPNYIQKHLRELAVIGIPYYVGVVKPDLLTIDVYSGKGLQALFYLHDWEELVEMVEAGSATVRNELAVEYQGIPVRRDGDIFTVVLYRVATLTMATGYDSAETRVWIDDCEESLNTIYSAKAGEFMFHGPPDQFTQWVGIGTFTHALRRFMHASTMLSEVLCRTNAFIQPDNSADRAFLMELGNCALHVDRVKSRLRNQELCRKIIDERLWRMWTRNVTAIGRDAETMLRDYEAD